MPSSTLHSSRHNRDSLSRSRRSGPSSSAPSTQPPPTLPDYEPPSAPLNPAGKRALARLLQSDRLSTLKGHIEDVGKKLTGSAGEVNEHATDARVRYEKRLRKKREREPEQENNGDEADEEEAERLTRMEEKVRAVTGSLEESMRGVIDAEVRLGGLLDGIGELERDEENGDVGRRVRGRRTRRAAGQEDEGEGGEEDEGEAEPGVPPTEELNEKIGRRQADWGDQSLTERYSTNNAYIGFYRVLHDAKHPNDEVPPLPHSSTWFAHLEDPTAQSQGPQPASQLGKRRARDPSPAESDDIAIERERVSLKCPLTLLPFRDPVTSTKCPHSFEREAIESMLAQSSLDRPVPNAGRRSRIRYVKCPVCSLELTKNDLQSDPALLRKVRRAEALSQREEEDEELNGGRSKRRITLGSDTGLESESEDDVEDSGMRNEAARIKQEKAASVFGGDEG